MNQKLLIKCWVCGDPANSGEHKTKRSDMKDVFGQPSQSAPLRYHDKTKKNIPIGSLRNKHLKSPSLICSNCNNARTQPYDIAWEKLSKALRSRDPIPAAAGRIRANRIFNYDTRKQMLNVHLYFVKLFGCHIVESKIPINISTFSNAILNNKAHPCVYLKFGYCNTGPFGRHVGMSDIETAQTVDGKCAFATWFYEVANLAVNVMYAEDSENRQGLINAWHPRLGTSKLNIECFFEPPGENG